MKFNVSKWILHSKSEGGFWNNKRGWVYGAGQATKFKGSEVNFKPTMMGVLDCEWLPYEYDE